MQVTTSGTSLDIALMEAPDRRVYELARSGPGTLTLRVTRKG